MALAFGGGVRPELGRTDYGAVARGGEMQAQLSAQGSQMMGKGIASLGESLGKGIAEYGKAKDENKQMQAEFKSASMMGKALLGSSFIPEETKGIVGGLMEQLSSPDLTTRERGALSKALNEQFGGVLSMGLKVSMEAEKKAAEAEKKAAIGVALGAGDIAQAQRLGAPPEQINAAINLFKTKQADEESQRKNYDAEGTAVILNEAKTLEEAIGIANTYGITDYNPLIKSWGELQTLKPGKEDNLRVVPREVTLPNGKTISFAAVYTGSQWQILHPADDPKDTASTRDRAYTFKIITEAEEAYRKGDRSLAIRLLRSAGLRLYPQQELTDDDLDVYFAAPDGDGATKKPVDGATKKPVDRSVKPPAGWTLRPS